MQIKADDDFIYLYGVPKGDEKMMERFFAAVPSKKGHWRMWRNRFVMRDLYKAFPGLRSDPHFLQLGREIQLARDALFAVHKDTAPLSVPELRPYQQQDAAILAKLGSGGVFNDPRTGKTPTIITTIRTLNKLRNLIVCPASLLYNWKQEVNAWWPECEVLVYDGPQKAKLLNAFGGVTWPQAIIISKDQVGKVNHMDFDTCVVDEAHYLRSHDTVQSKNTLSIKAQHKFALTGTPTIKHPSDMYGLLKFLNPKRYPSYWQFVNYFFNVRERHDTGMLYADDLKGYRAEEFQETVGLISTQRKRKDVMPWLPEKERVRMVTTMTTKQKKLYHEMKKYFVAQDEDHQIDVPNIITQLMRLRQLSLDPRLLGFEEVGGKTKAVMEWLENNREPVIIMSMFTSYLMLLKKDIAKLGLKVGEIHGQMPNKEKHAAAGSFQAGRTDVLLCNIISAGTGFTLDRSTTVLFLDTAWNPSENEQAEDRICPTNKDRLHKHYILNMVAADSVDARMLEILQRKQDLTAYINEGGWKAAKGLV